MRTPFQELQKCIQKAYLKAALKSHPDKNGGNEAAVAQFKLVNAANVFLSDPSKKLKHDLYHDYITVYSFDNSVPESDDDGDDSELDEPEDKENRENENGRKAGGAAALPSGRAAQPGWDLGLINQAPECIYTIR